MRKLGDTIKLFQVFQVEREHNTEQSIPIISDGVLKSEQHTQIRFFATSCFVYFNYSRIEVMMLITSPQKDIVEHKFCAYLDSCSHETRFTNPVGT